MKKTIITLIVLITIAGIFYSLNRTKQTSFKELVLDNIPEEGKLSVVLRQHSEGSSNSKPVYVDDPAVAKKLLESFSNMELKKTDDKEINELYSIGIKINNETEFSLEIMQDPNYVWVYNKDGLRAYEVINDFDPINVIEEQTFVWKNAF